VTVLLHGNWDQVIAAELCSLGLQSEGARQPLWVQTAERRSQERDAALKGGSVGGSDGRDPGDSVSSAAKMCLGDV
jgi:hypothetical protein